MASSAANVKASDKIRHGSEGAAGLLKDLGANSIIPRTPEPETGGSALQRDIEKGGGTTTRSAGTVHLPSSSQGNQLRNTQQDQQTERLAQRILAPTNVVPSTSPLSMPMPTFERPTAQPTVELPRISSMAPTGTASGSGYTQAASLMPSTTDIGDALAGGVKGVMNELGYDPDREPWEEEWNLRAAEREGISPRTANVLGQAYDMDGDREGLYRDNQLGAVGNTPTNDAYMRNALDNGMDRQTMYDLYERMTNGDSYWKDLLDKWGTPAGALEKNKHSTGDFTVMDDGTVYDYDHMTSDRMTGAQYMRYVEMGMGGRPIQEIDPKQTYSKRREAIDYGFIPFTPDDTSVQHMAAMNLTDLPGRLGSAVANLRQTLTPDYKINIGDKSVSGREFDKRSRAYINQFDREVKTHPMRLLRQQGNRDSSPMIREFSVPDANDNMTYHYGRLLSVSENVDGTFRMEFSDGSAVNVSERYLDANTDNDDNISLESSGFIPVSQAKGIVPSNLESLNDIGYISSRVKKDGGTPIDYADVLFVPEFEMGDGTTLTLDEVQRAFYDQTEENDEGTDDDDISYEFSNFGPISNKPTKFTNEIFSLENGFGPQSFDLSDLGDSIVDWTLGSIPISMQGARLGYIPLAYSLSNAATAASGVDPGTYDPSTDSYGLIAGDYDRKGNYRYGVADAQGNVDQELSDQTRWSNAIGNALVPLTENLAGNIGSDPFKNALHKMGLPELAKDPFTGRYIDATAKQVIADTLVDMFGEGIEEDVGNVFDQLTQYGGLRGLAANPIYDERGNKMYDAAGHELRDYDTSFWDRLLNMVRPESWEDLVNSFIGGAGVSGAMTAGNLRPWLPAEVARAAQRDMARISNGVPQYIRPENVERRRAPESYLESFNELA